MAIEATRGASDSAENTGVLGDSGLQVKDGDGHTKDADSTMDAYGKTRSSDTGLKSTDNIETVSEAGSGGGALSTNAAGWREDTNEGR